MLIEKVIRNFRKDLFSLTSHAMKTYGPAPDQG